MSEARKRSTQLTLVAVIIIFIVISNAMFVFLVIERIKNDARIINYTGIVRGSIQRISKLELAGVKADKYIEDINTILEDFDKHGKGLDILKKSSKYIELEQELRKEWKLLQVKILELRESSYPEDRSRVFEISEKCWTIANALVFEAQSISEGKLVFMRFVFIISGVNIAAVILIIVLIRRHVRNKLEYLASYDHLTGILNRYSFNVILKQEINLMKRRRSLLSLLIFDIDHFKRVNDKFGHDAGDYVLKKLSELISNGMRNSDAFFRIGGEEFAVVADETKIEQAKILAEKMRNIVNSYDFDKVGKVSISIGIAEYRENETQEAFFKRADNALYTAKKQGRNCVIADQA